MGSAPCAFVSWKVTGSPGVDMSCGSAMSYTSCGNARSGKSISANELTKLHAKYRVVPHVDTHEKNKAVVEWFCIF